MNVARGLSRLPGACYASAIDVANPSGRTGAHFGPVSLALSLAVLAGSVRWRSSTNS